MRLALLAAFALAGSLYAALAFHAYGEEGAARADAPHQAPTPHRHPEANLRVLREAFDAGDYSDDLLPVLDRALEEAPSFYQPAFLVTTFYANRFEQPGKVRAGFEAALKRFPSNGRLHLTFAQWLLAPRPTAPYRVFREQRSPEEQERTVELALEHVEEATRLEPELTRSALNLMLRARLAPSRWSERLPRTNDTRRLLLEALERAPRDRAARERLLRELLAEPADPRLDRAVSEYAARWGYPELASAASERWLASSLEAHDSGEARRATAALVRQRLEAGESERAYALLRETLRTLEERNAPDEDVVALLAAAGEIYLNHRRTALAQGLFTEAVTLSPYHVPSRLGLARIYRETGDLESAKGELERVLALEPTNAQARTLLELVER